MARSLVQNKRQETWLVRTRFHTGATFLAMKELNVAAQSNQHFNDYIWCMTWYIAITHSPESVGGSLPIVILVISRLHCKSLNEKLDLHPIYPEQIWCQKFQTMGVINTVFVLEFTTPQGTYHLCPWSLLCSIALSIFLHHICSGHMHLMLIDLSTVFSTFDMDNLEKIHPLCWKERL